MRSGAGQYRLTRTGLLRSTSRWRTPIQALLLFTVILLIWSKAIVPAKNSRHLRRFDYDAVDIWLNHARHFPIEGSDRYALHDMGFRAKTYANALTQWQEMDVQKLDTILWPFLPHARQMREDIGLPLGASRRKGLYPRAGSRASRRGIVTSSDGLRLRKTLELVSNLRSVQNCTLPIEIYYDGDDEIPHVWQNALSSLSDVRLTKILHVPYFDDRHLGYAELDRRTTSAEQAIAMAATTMNEIIYIEPGTTFFINPEQLFLEQGYRETGTLFFHSAIRPQTPESQNFVNYLNKQLDRGSPSKSFGTSPFYYNTASAHQDPSVVVLDKRRPTVFSGLLFNLWMHTKAVRRSLWHIHFLDSLHETLWVAFEMAKLPYHFSPSFPGAIGQEDKVDTWDQRICPAHPLHIIGHDVNAKFRGQPIWASGSLRTSEGSNDYLSVDSWTRHGKWHLTEQGWCVSGAQPRSTSEYSLAWLFKKSISVDQSLDDILRPLFGQLRAM